MKKKIILATLLSATAAISMANFASASVSVSSPTTAKICKTITNAYDATTATFEYNFSTTATGISGLPTGQQIVFTNEAYDSNHEVNKCIDVDITGITFASNSPQQASISVTETAVSGYSADTTTYTLLVDSRNTIDANNNITGQVGTAYLQNASGTKLTQFDFTSSKSYSNSSIQINKTVKGNAGDTEKLFKYTVNVTGTAGTTYSVYGASAGSGSASSCTANSACIVYLKHGDSVRIGYNGTADQIPVGETYVVTEETYSDYDTTVAVGGGAASTARTTGTQTVMPNSSANVADFVNAKTSSTPTGIFISIWPYVLLGAISLGAVVYAKKAYSAKK